MGRSGNFATIWQTLFIESALLTESQPGNLPVERPMTFKLGINLETAKLTGLTIPLTLLFQAEEVSQ